MYIEGWAHQEHAQNARRSDRVGLIHCRDWSEYIAMKRQVDNGITKPTTGILSRA